MLLTVGSLFAGIGGIDLGFERAGWMVAWQVEIDEWCRSVLAKHFPKAERFIEKQKLGEAAAWAGLAVRSLQACTNELVDAIQSALCNPDCDDGQSSEKPEAGA